MCCLQKPAGSVLYFSGNMLSGRQSSGSLQCCIYSQSLGAKGLDPDTHFLHISVVKDWENEVFSKKHHYFYFCLWSRPERQDVLKMFSVTHRTGLSPFESVHNWPRHVFPLLFLWYFSPVQSNIITVSLYTKVGKPYSLYEFTSGILLPSEGFF